MPEAIATPSTKPSGEMGQKRVVSFFFVDPKNGLDPNGNFCLNMIQLG